MRGKRAVDVFEEHTEALRAAVGDSFIVASRTRCDNLGGYATIRAQAQDSFSLAYLLDDLPGHEFWSEEGQRRFPDLPRGSMHFMDLRAGGNARFGSTFDTLNVLIPRKALAALAEQTGCQAPTDLREPAPWAAGDALVASLEPALLHAIAVGPSMDPLVGDHLILALVTHIASRYGGMKQPRSLLRGALARWQLQRAMDIMSSNLNGRVSLAEVASCCCISPSHFSRAFKSSTGVTPSAWMLRLRVDRAKDLLRGSDVSIAEVASQCGFADQAHFTRTFSRHVGESPGLWRRSSRLP
jgi:AraC-like DNA-binding protein